MSILLKVANTAAEKHASFNRPTGIKPEKPKGLFGKLMGAPNSVWQAGMTGIDMVKRVASTGFSTMSSGGGL